jgi:hypothetical protein
MPGQRRLGIIGQTDTNHAIPGPFRAVGDQKGQAPLSGDQTQCFWLNVQIFRHRLTLINADFYFIFLSVHASSYGLKGKPILAQGSALGLEFPISIFALKGQHKQPQFYPDYLGLSGQKFA